LSFRPNHLSLTFCLPTLKGVKIMTGNNSSITSRPRNVLRSCFGVILGVTVVGAATLGCPEALGFSLSFRTQHNLFRVEVTTEATPAEPEDVAHVG
jgi:hypothetical protein